MKWMRVNTPSQEYLMDLHEIESAIRFADGKIQVFWKSGRVTELTAADELWAQLITHMELGPSPTKSAQAPSQYAPGRPGIKLLSHE